MLDPRKLLLLAVLASTAHAADVYTVDPATSTVEIVVGKAGLFSRFGHVHHVFARDMKGEVHVDAAHPDRSTVKLTFPAAGLKVEDSDLSEKDRKSVEEHMQAEPVLGVEKWAEIRFVSDAVRETAVHGAVHEIGLSGTLDLRGVRKPLELPVKVTLAGDHLEVTGQTAFKQTLFGLTPNRVALGAVSVKDELTIKFHVVARKKKD